MTLLCSIYSGQIHIPTNRRITMTAFSKKIVLLETLLKLQGIQTRRLDLTQERKFLILARLFYSEKGVLSQVICADLVHISTSQVQKITEKLVSQGLIARESGAPNGGTLIKITDKGRKYIEITLNEQARGLIEIENLPTHNRNETLNPEAIIDQIIEQLSTTLK